MISVQSVASGGVIFSPILDNMVNQLNIEAAESFAKENNSSSGDNAGEIDHNKI